MKRKSKENIEKTSVKKVKSDSVIDNNAEEKSAPQNGVPKKQKTKPNFQVKQFRKKLHENDFMTEFHQFLQSALADSSVISSYLEAKGQPFELVSCLERVDKDSTAHISCVFQVLQLVFIEILSSSQEYTENAVRSGRFLINKHRKLVEKLLESSVPSHKVSVLKLLTALVTLDARLGFDILRVFKSVVQSDFQLEHFTRIPKEESTDENVRTSFVHFIMAFFIEGNNILIRNIMDKVEFLKAILVELYLDKPENIVLVLGTCKSFLLKSPVVSKSQKFQLFDSQIVKNLIKIYQNEGIVKNEEMRQKVIQVGQDFLILLLSSYKYGIAIQCLGEKGRNNLVPKDVIRGMSQPWKRLGQTELVIQILKACPELTGFYFSLVSKQMDINQIENYLKCIELIGTIIENLTPKIAIRGGYQNVSSTEMGHLVGNICLNSEVLDKIKDRALKNDKIGIRLATIILLKKMLVQLKNYFQFLETFAGIRNMKMELFAHIFLKFPAADNIIHSLYQTINQKGVDKEVVLEHLEMTIDVLLTATETIPSFIEKTSNLINYLQILNPIYSDIEGEGNELKCRIELKTIKLILLLDPQVLAANTNLFQQIIKSFLNVYIFGDQNSQNQVRPLLRSVLLNTGLFENGVLEVDLWLESFRGIDQKNISVVVQHFIHLIMNVKNQITEVDLTFHQDSKTENYKKILKSIDKNDTITGIFDVPMSISLLSNALKSSKKIQQSIHLRKYYDNLLFFYVHYLPENQMETIGKLIEKKDFLLENYLLSWFKQNQVIFPDEFEYKTINKILTNIHQGVFSEIEDITNENASKLVTYVYKIMFFVIQLNRIQKLNSEMAESAGKYVITLLELIQKDDQMIVEGSPEIALSITKPTGDKSDQNYSNLELVLKYIFHGQIEFLRIINFFKEDSSGIVKIITEIIKFSNTLERTNFLNLTKNYRSKFLQEVKLFMKEKSELSHLDNILEIFNLLDWEIEETSELLQILLDVTSDDKSCNYQLKLELISELFRSLSNGSDLNKMAEIDVERIIQVYKKIFTSEEVEQFSEIVTKLANNLVEYYEKVFDKIDSIDNDLFKMIYNSNTTCKSSIALMVFLLDRKYKNLEDCFVDLLKENYQKKELTYPALEVAFKNNIQIEDKNLLKTIFNEYKSGILKSIEKPNKAGVIYKEHPFTSGKLLESSMPIKECQEWCRKLIKSDVVETFQIDLVKIMHQKCVLEASDDDQKDQFVQHFIEVMINFAQILFKRYDSSKFEYMTEIIHDWLKEYKSEERNWETLCASPNWSSFLRNCLKFGMQKSENEENNPILLDLMTIMIEAFYPVGEYPDMRQYYEMAFSHSEFFEIMLSNETSRKLPLVRILYTMAFRSEKSIYQKNHIPILLAAYSAKMKPSDRMILALIHCYEFCGVNLAEFKPFLWGEAAVSHYSLTGMESLEKFQIMESNADQVFSLIDNDTMKSTILNFPIWRRLNPLEDLPSVVLSKNKQEMTKTIIENLVESGKEISDLNKRLLSRKEDGFYESYDPAFFVPLMAMIFSPESNNSTVAVAQNGMLALVFEALSSYDNEMRMAAGLALVRYRRQLEGKKNFLDQQVWSQFFGGISKGLEAIKQKDEQCPRLSHISAVFMAKSTIILTQPLIKMYKPISDYALSKETYDFATVPNFNFLFLSSDVEHQNYREFLLEIIQAGLKCEEDFDILDVSGTLEIFFAFFSCPFANIDTNLRILNIINTIARIPNANKTLIEKFGLFVCLNGIITNLEPFYFDTIEALVHIIYNVYYSIKSLETNFTNFVELKFKLFCLIKKVVDIIIVGQKSLKSNYKLKIVVKILTLFSGLLNENSVKLITENDVIDLIDLGASFCLEKESNFITSTKYCLEHYNGHLHKDDDVFLTKLKFEVESEEKLELILNIRKFVNSYLLHK